MTATREIHVHLLPPEDAGPIALPMVLHFDSADPFAVHATFRTGQGEGVVWVFARELLTVGVQRPCGDGDVRVWPSSWDGQDVVYLALNSPDGAALLRVAAEPLVEFLSRSYAIVPHGREADHLDVDRVIEALFTR